MRLRNAGIPDEKVAARILAKVIKEGASAESIPPKQLDAVWYWMDAFIVSATEQAGLTPDRGLGDLVTERQKLFLRELSHKYRAILKRLVKLCPLTFEDHQLQEATRCWLYGFRRAAILLSASALEARLNHATGATRLESYKDLVDNAFALGTLKSPFDQRARDVFPMRNRVAHDDTFEPTSEDAEEVLTWSRGILTDLHERSVF